MLQFTQHEQQRGAVEGGIGAGRRTARPGQHQDVRGAGAALDGRERPPGDVRGVRQGAHHQRT